MKFKNPQKTTLEELRKIMEENGGNLYLGGTAITALPDNLTVGDWPNLRSTAITSLPDNLTVRGNLDLRGTAITTLPDNLTVRGSLYIDDTKITALPDNLTVDGEIYILVDGRYTFTERRRRSKHDTLRDC